MREIAKLAATSLGLMTALVLPSVATSPADEGSIWSRADEATDTMQVGREGDARAGNAGPGKSTSGQSQDRYLRADATACLTFDDLEAVQAITTAPGACPQNTTEAQITPACDGTRLHALWVQRLRKDGTYANPEQLTDDQCITPADLTTQARHAFRTLHIPTPTATLQATPPLLVNIHYPAYTTATPHDRDTTLLDIPLTIRAEPTRYTWDFDDPHSTSNTLTTTDP
ncbi:hypothetical protein, partial [Isoptericola sp. NPDC055881]